MAQSIGDMSNDDWNTFIGRFTDWGANSHDPGW